MSDGTPIIIKKKKVAHAAHHGGSWKVAYADFVTAMMAFFMVMWIMGLSDSAKSQIQGYFNDPLGFVKNEPKTQVNIASFRSSPPRTGPWNQNGGGSQGDSAAKADEDAVRKLGKEIAQAMDQAAEGNGQLQEVLKHVEFVVTDEGLRIEFIEGAGAVFFDTGSSIIRPQAKQLIARVAPLIAASGRKIVIEGHTDARPYSKPDGYDNWDLSNDRAQSMRRLLKSMSVPEKRVIEVRGFAATQLRKPEDPFDYTNRRVSVLLAFNRLGETEVGTPSNDLKDHIQGMFRRPVDVAPERARP